MSYEWHVEFRLDFPPWREAETLLREDLARAGKAPRRREIEEKAKEQLGQVLQKRGPFSAVSDCYSRFRLLAQTMGIDGAVGEEAEERSKSQWSTLAREVHLQKILEPKYYYEEHIRQMEAYLSALGLPTPCLKEADLARLLKHSFFLYIPFTLAAPFLSKDDAPFYVHENPVRKDRVFRVPLMASTSWKGAFRAALRYALKTDDNDARIIRLLGNPKGAEDDFRRGRLVFFPTFFDRLGVEVINPHSRKTGAGTQPIYFEGVPEDGRGQFALLYIPMIPAEPHGPLPDWAEVLEDLELVGQATFTLLAELGFGAKAAGGMARARPEVPGAYCLVHRWVRAPMEIPPPPFPEEPPPEFQPPSDRFLDEHGRWPLYESKEEIEKHIQGAKARSRYKRERQAYFEWKKRREAWEAWKQEVAAKEGQEVKRMTRVELSRLEDLLELRHRVEAQMREKADG